MNTKSILALVTVGHLWLHVPTLRGALYSFTRITDTPDYEALTAPGDGSINNDGTVAFWGAQSGRGSFLAGSGGPLITIGQFNSCAGRPTINDSGMVALTTTDAPSGGAILIGDGNALTTVVNASTSLSNLGGPFINDSSLIVFKSNNQTYPWGGQWEINMMKDGELSNVVSADLDPFTRLGDISINNSDEVAFAGDRFQGTSGIFLKDQSGVRTIADTAGEFSGFCSGLSLNDVGVVAVVAGLDSGGEAIIAATTSGNRRIADNSGAFSSFAGTPDINDDGLVAFVAHLRAGGDGVFTGPDQFSDKVIATGDYLFGARVEQLASEVGINGSGQVAFWAQLEDGTLGIYRADIVPEPTTLSLLALSGLALIRRRAR